MTKEDQAQEYFTKAMRAVVEQSGADDVIKNLESALKLGLPPRDEAKARIFLGNEYARIERSREGIEQIEEALRIASSIDEEVLEDYGVYAMIAETYAAEVLRLMSEEEILAESLMGKAKKYLVLWQLNLCGVASFSLRL